MSRRVYDSPQWRRLRKVVLARDGYVCQIKGPKCTGRANHCDHIVAMSEGGAAYDLANLRAACAACNIAKRNTDVATAARRARGVDDERALNPSSGWLDPEPTTPW